MYQLRVYLRSHPNWNSNFDLHYFYVVFKPTAYYQTQFHGGSVKPESLFAAKATFREKYEWHR